MYDLITQTYKVSKHSICKVLASVCSSCNGAIRTREINKLEVDAQSRRNIVKINVYFDGVI